MNGELSMFFFMSICLVIIGATFLFIPSMSRVDIYFGIRMPKFLRKREDMKKIRSRFNINIISYTIATILVYAIGYYLIYKWGLGEKFQASWLIFITLIQMALLQLAYYIAYKTVRTIKAKEKDSGNWNVARKISIVDTKLSKEINKVNYWWLLPFIIVLFEVILVASNYSNLPEQIPMHYNALGEVDRYTNKTPVNAMMLPIISFGMTVFLYVTTVITKRSKKEINSLNTEKSRAQLRLYYKYLEVFMAITSAMLGITFLVGDLSLVGILPSKYMLSIILIISLILVVFATVFFIKIGQGGCKLKIKDVEDKEEEELFIDKDDDEYWIMGTFYYNKEDPSLMVEKRSGGGWTVNLGTTLGMILTIAPIILIIVLCIAIPMRG